MAQQPEVQIVEQKQNPNEIQLDTVIDKITCGLAWDFFDKKIDLDVTVVAMDSYALEMDAAFYNQKTILDGAIIHSGDDKSGAGDGDDEHIKIDLKKLPQRCKSLWFIVNAFSGGKFTDVETARFNLYDGNDHSKVLYSYGVGMAFDSTALLLGVLSVNDPYSANKQWSFKMIQERGNGTNFVESRPLLNAKLNILYEDGILMERPSDRTKQYKLEKGDMYVIDPDIKTIRVGLGWDAGSGDIDVDASVIIFNELKAEDNRSLYGTLTDRKFELTDVVFFNNKNYQGAVIHHGDNLTGDGDGDDEVITINLNNMDTNKDADVCCVVINIYSGSASFSQIQNCFCRLIDDKDNELCRFNLTDEYNTQAMIMCHVEKRRNGLWGLITDGQGCSGQTAKESVNDAGKILGGQLLSTGPTCRNDADEECCCILM